jgi:hypothetical protein
VVTEWYSDIPWHQKLGTQGGNEIDEALVLPYEALGDNEKAFCKNPTDPAQQADCMIEIGVNNILGIYRIDTPYDPRYPNTYAKGKCQSNLQPPQKCIEVKLALSMFWTRSTDCFNPNATAPCLQARPFGAHNAELPYPPPGNPAYYGGYAITDGTSYAPQLPWFMSHYCDAGFKKIPGTAPPVYPDALDPVCYADYLSTFNDGFNALDTTAGTDWPNSAPWSVYPFAAPPAYNNSCVPLQTTCTLAMAGFDLSPVPKNETDLQYYTYTPSGGGTSTPNHNLLTWFSNAVQNFPRNFTQADFYRHFPWSGAAVNWATDLWPQAVLNPFLGQFSFKPQAGGSADCTVTHDGPSTSGCTTTPVRADHYLYPRQCNLADLAVTKGNANVPRLRACGLNYELHHNGYLEEFGPVGIEIERAPL